MCRAGVVGRLASKQLLGNLAMRARGTVLLPVAPVQGEGLAGFYKEAEQDPEMEDYPAAELQRQLGVQFHIHENVLLRMAHRSASPGTRGGFFPLEKLEMRPGVWRPMVCRRPGSAGSSGHTEPGSESHSFVEDEAPP